MISLFVSTGKVVCFLLRNICTYPIRHTTVTLLVRMHAYDFCTPSTPTFLSLQTACQAEIIDELPQTGQIVNKIRLENKNESERKTEKKVIKCNTTHNALVEGSYTLRTHFRGSKVRKIENVKTMHDSLKPPVLPPALLRRLGFVNAVWLGGQGVSRKTLQA